MSVTVHATAIVDAKAELRLTGWPFILLSIICVAVLNWGVYLGVDTAGVPEELGVFKFA